MKASARDGTSARCNHMFSIVVSFKLLFVIIKVGDNPHAARSLTYSKCCSCTENSSLAKKK